MAIPILGFGVFESYLGHKEPESQSFDGWVSFVDWKSKNHGMPLIEIKRENGTVKRFHHSRIVLSSEQLNVGDRFIKESGSKYCDINGKAILCVNKHLTKTVS